MSGSPVKPPRAVLDANILVRALITPKGFTAKLVDALTERKFTLVTSEAILAESRTSWLAPKSNVSAPFLPTR